MGGVVWGDKTQGNTQGGDMRGKKGNWNSSSAPRGPAAGSNLEAERGGGYMVKYMDK